ncbi:hypothetical protein ACFQ4C_26695 [Larkinella insperata]|uniref:DUF4468 domain-containing protein n=1 Tax=Larkinella insperata TaxID=332158 RepID=A0ABW3QFL7_9BACT|nr:hypothetical protein [Larkinella insperata]
MKNLLCLLLLVASPVFAQSDGLFRKGNTVYVESTSKNQNSQETEQAFSESLRESGFWNVVSEKQQANYIIKLDVEASKGITLTSWGGTSIGCRAKIYNKNEALVWESDTYRVSPNGTNGFNAKKASARKLARAIERKVK